MKRRRKPEDPGEKDLYDREDDADDEEEKRKEEDDKGATEKKEDTDAAAKAPSVAWDSKPVAVASEASFEIALGHAEA